MLDFLIRRVSFLLILLLPFAVQAQTPGGVDNDALWLRADTGVSGSTAVNLWNDQSGSGNHASQSNTVRMPSLNNSSLNFNPTLGFDNDYLSIPYDADINANNVSFFMVYDYTGPGSGYQSVLTSRNDNASGGYNYYITPSFGRQVWTARGSGGWDISDSGSTYNRDAELYAAALRAGTGTGTSDQYLFGNNISSQSGKTFVPLTNPAYDTLIGGGGDSTNVKFYWYGNIAEVIVYPDILSSSDRVKVESYLAVKYGMTLSSTVTSYRNSANVAIWTDTGFWNDIFGLAQDNGSALDQRIAKSINSDAIITLSTNNDFTSANQNVSRASIGEGNILLVGNNNAGSGWTSAGAPTDTQILQRKWKVKKTGSPGAQNIQFDVDNTNFNVASPLSEGYFIIYDSDNDGSLADETPNRLINTSGNLWSTSIDLPDGATFTLATTDGIAVLEATKAITNVLGNIPYLIPGNDVVYQITLKNRGTEAIDADTVLLIDELPAEVEFFNGDMDDAGPGTTAVTYTSTGSTGLSFNYLTDVKYSNTTIKPASFSACNYTPSINYDPSVTFICLNPKGSMSAGVPAPSVTFSFRVRIK